MNAGEVRNQGWELAASYFGTAGENFKFNISANVTNNTNEVLALPGIEGGQIISGTRVLRVGEPLYSFYGLSFDGIYQNQEEIDNGPNPIDGKTAPGYRRYEDLSGPDGEPDGRVDNNFDRDIIGNSFPRYVYGFNAQANFKGFDLLLTLSGIAGVDRTRPQNGNDPDQGNMLRSWLDRWSPTNPTNAFPLVGSDRLFSSWDLVDGSYLRLKVGELGYTVPKTLTQRWNIERLRVYVSGTNLLTFTNYIEGFDPEKAASNRRSENYPLNRNYVFGVNLNF
ncbi:MAG: hypothetical protein AAF705_11130 [Bacteroidota bacterium]